MYLKDILHIYFYTLDVKILFCNKHIIWFNRYHINRIINKKIPGSYILINNKYKTFHAHAFNQFKRILTIEDTINIILKSITTDFEESLIDTINSIFSNNWIFIPFHKSNKTQYR